jgi:hypothetical protein
MLGIDDNFPEQKVQSLEVLAASISVISRIPVITVMNTILPPAAAILTVLAYAHLFQTICPGRVLWCVIGTMAFIFANGQAEMSYGNIFLARMFHGKAILFSVITPLIISYSIRFIAHTNTSDLALLTAAHVAGVGFAPAACWTQPIISILALLVATPHPVQSFKLILNGMLASVYPIYAGIYLISVDKSPESGMNSGQLYELLGRQAIGYTNFIVFILLSMMGTWLFVNERLTRRLCLIFPIGLLIFINPFTVTKVANCITSTSALWQCIWILPLPAIAGLLLAAPLGPQSIKITQRHLAYITFIFILATGQTNILSAKNQIRISWPTLEIDKTYHGMAEQLKHVMKEQKHIVAPAEITTAMTLTYGPPYPIFAHPAHLARYARFLGIRETVERSVVQQYITGKYKPSKQEFLRNTLAKYKIDGICMPSSNQWKDEIRKTLINDGFEELAHILNNEIWVRDSILK